MCGFIVLWLWHVKNIAQLMFWDSTFTDKLVANFTGYENSEGRTCTDYTIYNMLYVMHII